MILLIAEYESLRFAKHSKLYLCVMQFHHREAPPRNKNKGGFISLVSSGNREARPRGFLYFTSE